VSKGWAAGSQAGWRDRVRPLVLTRDKHTCRLKIEGVCTTRATDVHHTHGKLVTGDDIRYLVAACRECNLKVGEPKPDPRPKRGTRW
jgi:5-methylcytosine-specific restriction endonuclease McrA